MAQGPERRTRRLQLAKLRESPRGDKSGAHGTVGEMAYIGTAESLMAHPA